MLGRDQAAFAEDRGAFEDVAQLADVAGPVIFDQPLARVARDAGRRASQAAADLAEERFAQRQDVVAAIAERRQVDRKHVQAIEEILAELALAGSRAANRGWWRR